MEDITALPQHFMQDANYLEKPFLPVELARKVRTLLNESGARRSSTGRTA
jgi:hypothetical protein